MFPLELSEIRIVMIIIDMIIICIYINSIIKIITIIGIEGMLVSQMFISHACKCMNKFIF